MVIDTTSYIEKSILTDSIIFCATYRIWTLNDQYNIKHYATAHEGDLLPLFENDTIQVYNQNFALNDLYYDSFITNKHWDYKDSPMVAFIWKIFSFNFCKKNYIVVHVIDKQINGFNPFIFSILFDITDTCNVTASPIGEIASTITPNYIENLNNDDKIDIVPWYFQDTLRAVNLVNNEFIELNDKFIVFNHRKKDLEVKINYQNSNWFVPLKPTRIIGDCSWNIFHPDYANMYIDNFKPSGCE